MGREIRQFVSGSGKVTSEVQGEVLRKRSSTVRDTTEFCFTTQRDEDERAAWLGVSIHTGEEPAEGQGVTGYPGLGLRHLTSEPSPSSCPCVASQHFPLSALSVPLCVGTPVPAPQVLLGYLSFICASQNFCYFLKGSNLPS